MTTTAALLLCLMAATLPAVVGWLLPPLPESSVDGVPGAVVVLGGGCVRQESRWRMTASSRRRLLAGIEQARERGLPLVLSGGGCGDNGPSEAALMAALAGERAPELEVLQEDKSANTWENAAYSRELLRRRGIGRVVLVTDRPHLTRATLCFQRHGLAVEPVPSSRLPSPAWVPSTGALNMLPELWYEWAALAWYEMRYF